MPPSLAPLLRKIPTLAPVPHRSLLYVHGSQASEFLNGVISISVPTPPKGHLYSCFLHAQGRVLYDVFLYNKKDARGNDGYFVEYDARPSEAPALLPFLKRYILRSKVRIEDVSSEYQVWSSWGSEHEAKWDSQRHWTWTNSGVAEPVWEGEQWPWGNSDMVLKDRRAIGMGHRHLVRAGDKPPESQSYEMADADTYTLHRIMHGVPEGVVDIPPMHAFPMESNLDIMGGLDFRKGCYVGQELTVRTYHTGAIRKRILPVAIEAASSSSSMPAAGSEIRAIAQLTEDASRTRVARPRGTGKLLSTCRNVGLALMRLEQVKGVEGGLLRFQIKDDENEWSVNHLWPSSFPKPPDFMEHEEAS